MKQRFASSSSNNEAARQSLGSGGGAAQGSSAQRVAHSPAQVGATKPPASSSSLTPSRASRDSLLQDLEKIRKERAIEEDRLRSSSSRASFGDGVYTPLRGGGAAGGAPTLTGAGASRDGSSVGVVSGSPAPSPGAPPGSCAGGAGGLLGPSFSPVLQSQPAPAGRAGPASAHRMQQQHSRMGSLSTDDLPPPPPPVRASHGLDGAGSRGRCHEDRSPVAERNILSAEDVDYDGGRVGAAGAAAGGSSAE